jgi:hypothetical protein
MTVSSDVHTGLASRITSRTLVITSRECSRNWAVPRAVSSLSHRALITLQGAVHTWAPTRMAWRTCSAWRTDENMTLAP